MVTKGKGKSIMAPDERERQRPGGGGSRLSAWGLLAIAIMVGLLVWAGWYAVSSWNAMAGVRMSSAGWIFMVMGVVFTFLVGAGLMALIFYSSRHDMDR
jgi:hypothetical protein